MFRKSKPVLCSMQSQWFNSCHYGKGQGVFLFHTCVMAFKLQVEHYYSLPPCIETSGFQEAVVRMKEGFLAPKWPQKQSQSIYLYEIKKFLKWGGGGWHATRPPQLMCAHTRLPQPLSKFHCVDLGQHSGAKTGHFYANTGFMQGKGSHASCDSQFANCMVKM